MKPLSIKAKVTLWYSSLVLLLLFVTLTYLLLASDRLLTTGAESDLTTAVHDAIAAVEYSGGKADYDEVAFYQNGVSVFFYDENGFLIAPQGGRIIKIDLQLQTGAPRGFSDDSGNHWLIYDVQTPIGADTVWVRGVLLITAISGTISTILTVAVVSAPLLLLAAALGGWLITRRAFQPVQHITATAEAITGGSDLSKRIGLAGPQDEIGRLAATFDRMFDRLQQAFEDEKQFTADVSHELRTPIAAITAQSEYALGNSLSAAEQREALQNILQQSRKMSGLVSQLLMLARADSGKQPLELETVDVSELCQMIVEEMAPQALAAQLTLTADTAAGITVTGDQTLLMRLITNLLSNAIAYSRPGGAVAVSVRAQDGHCQITVSDTGIGIPPAHLDKIFNRFYQVNPARGGGSGLGLAMVKWIVSAHQGAITVDSVPGQGSTFTIRLPIL